MLSYNHWASITSCIETISSFSDMAPLLTLRSSCIWPPTPKTKPRWTQSVRMYVPASQETQNTAKFRLSSNSSSFDSWMVRIRNCRLTADMRGGRWNNAPVNVCSARGRAEGFGSPAWRRRTQTYSLPRATVKIYFVKHVKGLFALTSTLLRFDQPRCAINANYQTSCDFGVQSAAMTCFFDT